VWDGSASEFRARNAKSAGDSPCQRVLQRSDDDHKACRQIPAQICSDAPRGRGVSRVAGGAGVMDVNKRSAFATGAQLSVDKGLRAQQRALGGRSKASGTRVWVG